MRFEVFVVVKV